MKKAVTLQMCFNFTRVLKVMYPPAATPKIPTSTTLVARHPQLLTRRLMSSNSNLDMAEADKISTSPISFSSWYSFGDPCLDLFFHVKSRDQDHIGNDDEDDDIKQERQKQTSHYNHHRLNYLKQLLPVAWSHNPLTTLKLIFNLHSGISSKGRDYPEAFHTAVFWLHQNHPKTLLCNLPAFAGWKWGFNDLLDILYGLLEQGQDPTAGERLHRDPDYKLLHDQIMDLLAERWKSDVEKFKQHKLELKSFQDWDQLDEADHLLVSGTAVVCSLPDHHTSSILLRESIARRLFPPESDQSEEWERLTDALEPFLNYYMHRASLWNHTLERSEVKKCLEEVKAAAAAGGNLGGGIIKPDALLPNEIIKYAEDEDFGEAANLQWKAMVEDMYLKQQQKKGEEGLGKFTNCLAVCNITEDTAKLQRELGVSLGLLVSELNEDPAWKGKVISFGDLPDGQPQPQPLLHSIQGDDLKSKCEFMMRTCRMKSNESVDYRKVCDLILEVVENENLKAEQMIKKVFVLTDFTGFFSCTSKTLHEANQSKLEELEASGYDARPLPHILLWNISDWKYPHSEEHHPGVTLMSGVNDNLIKSFMDNGGEIGPRQVMEAAIADKEFQTFSVVD
ncbi:hypothetical protein PRUPE_5G035500 [Prunus persica]|uniref:Uncharacterized protein n=2 Tax=Prunus persica TaxID=3760 RepID=A0A251P380_PRUPE|nr:hypothetical protein PRUPE_5G035500 [Prunus persica]